MTTSKTPIATWHGTASVGSSPPPQAHKSFNGYRGGVLIRAARPRATRPHSARISRNLAPTGGQLFVSRGGSFLASAEAGIPAVQPPVDQYQPVRYVASSVPVRKVKRKVLYRPRSLLRRQGLNNRYLIRGGANRHTGEPKLSTAFSSFARRDTSIFVWPANCHRRAPQPTRSTEVRRWPGHQHPYRSRPTPSPGKSHSCSLPKTREKPTAPPASSARAASRLPIRTTSAPRTAPPADANAPSRSKTEAATSPPPPASHPPPQWLGRPDLTPSLAHSANVRTGRQSQPQ